VSIHAVENEILAPMQRAFLPPRGMEAAEQATALSEYGRALEGFDAADLKVAWREVRDTWVQRGWPTIAVFVLEARKARKSRAGDPPKRGFNPERTSEEKWDDWVKLRSSPIAARAVQENVAWSLKCGVLHDGKKAHELSLSELRMAKDRAERTRDKIEAGETIPYTMGGFTRMLKFSEENRNIALRMWETIQLREAETQEEIARNQQRLAAE